MGIRPAILGELLAVLGAMGGLGALIGLGEGLRAWGISGRHTRRLVHAGVGLFVAGTPFLFVRPFPVYVLAATFVGVNTIARTRHWWAAIHKARPMSWGTVALPLSVFPVLWATWSVSPDRLFAFQGAYLVLALADPAASWVGERATATEGPTPSTTVPGSLTFAGVTLTLTIPVLAASLPWPPSHVVGAAAMGAVVATCVEAVSRRGWDNLFVPVALLCVLVPLHESGVTVLDLGVAIGAGGAFGGLAYWAGALDRRGAATGGLFAASLVALGGTAWVIPGVAFFVLSSALSLLNGRTPDGKTDWDSPRRSQAQVLANGGAPWAALIVAALAPDGAPFVTDGAYAAFVGALAAAAADTWATELGASLGGAPWSLRTGRRVSAGTSGAVSGLGTVAAVLGAATVAGAAVLAGGSATGDLWWDVGIFVGAGVLGMAADSLAGAYLQAQYRGDGGTWHEGPPSTDATPARGWSAVGNNAVNAIGTALGAATALAGVLLLGA